VKYHTREGEENSLATILKTDRFQNTEIIHISVDKLHIKICKTTQK
jgi:hypothetical protein